MSKQKKRRGWRAYLLSPKRAFKAASTGLLAAAGGKWGLSTIAIVAQFAGYLAGVAAHRLAGWWLSIAIITGTGLLNGHYLYWFATRRIEPRVKEAERLAFRIQDALEEGRVRQSIADSDLAAPSGRPVGRQ